MITPFSKFLEESRNTKSKGTYVGVKYTDVSSMEFVRQMTELGIPNVIKPEKVHTTLLYSRVVVPVSTKPLVRSLVSFTPDVFVTQSGKRALVLKIDDPFFVDRHKEIRSIHPEATHDYDSYQPHITASYDIGDWNIDMDKITLASPLVTVGEYVEDLDLNW